MLALTRKPGESIIIGDNIRVRIVKIQGQQVRLGIEAPQDIPIRREELEDLPQNRQIPYEKKVSRLR